MGSTYYASQEFTKKAPHNQNVLGYSILNEIHYVGEHSRESQYIRVTQLGLNLSPAAAKLGTKPRTTTYNKAK
jgi:hypothetical protein